MTNEARKYPPQVQPSKIGYINKHVPSLIEAAITRENFHLFIYDRKEACFLVNYQGSQKILDMLELYVLPMTNDTWHYPREKRLAFFNTEGRFFNLARLVALEQDVIRDESTQKRHTATFMVPNELVGNEEKLSMPVPNIYSIAPALHPLMDTRCGYE